ncbi:MAG: hypothetical protein M1814_004980 [Vezdaea aestivalis]|nr:MAG: hypothetical protein M1814_004980 [Vezdaea aestivalis]
MSNNATNEPPASREEDGRIIANPFTLYAQPQPREWETQTTYKSWKKKFRKMKHVFDQKMRESDQLFQEEIKAKETMQRLQQSNDRLLDMLLDLNESVNIPLEHRYNLGLLQAPDVLDVPELDAHEPGYSSADSPAPIKNFHSLLQIPHTALETLTPEDLPEDLVPSNPAAYLTVSQEQDYVDSLDKTLGNPVITPRGVAIGLPGPAEPEPTPNPSIQNPVSVYNWLRKHQPQVFLQDHEMSSDKAIKTGDKRGAGKRASIAAAKATPEFVDDETYAFGYDQPTSSSGRKKKEEDPGYRPKGSNSRSLKRKREGEDGGGGGGKVSRKRSTGSAFKAH